MRFLLVAVLAVVVSSCAKVSTPPPTEPNPPASKTGEFDMSEMGESGHFAVIGAVAGQHGALLVSTTSGRTWELITEGGKRRWQPLTRPLMPKSPFIDQGTEEKSEAGELPDNEKPIPPDR